MPKADTVQCKLYGIRVGGIDYPAPKKICNDAKVVALDANKDGFIDEEDNTCDGLCRSKTFLSGLDPKFEKHAQYFADFSSMSFVINQAFDSVFCVEAIQLKALAGKLDLNEPLPCCIPYDLLGVMGAEIAIREFAKKYGWERNFGLYEQHMIFGSNLWSPEFVYRPLRTLDAADAAGVEAFIVKASSFDGHDLGDYIAPIAGDVIGKWNMLAAFMSDSVHANLCVPMSARIFPDRTDEKINEKADQKEAEFQLRGFNLPVIVVDVEH